MNKRLAILTLLALTLAAIPAVAAPPGAFDRSGPRQERMARVLELTAAQQESIEGIRREERAKSAPLRQALAEGREQLRRLAEADSFDEAAVRALAASQAATRTELIVARTRAQNRIHALLTPEQRALAEKLRPEPGEHRGHRSPPPPETEEDEEP